MRRRGVGRLTQLLLLAVVLGLALAQPSAAQPANDSCESAHPVTGEFNEFELSLHSATDSFWFWEYCPHADLCDVTAIFSGSDQFFSVELEAGETLTCYLVDANGEFVTNRQVQLYLLDSCEPAKSSWLHGSSLMPTLIVHEAVEPVSLVIMANCDGPPSGCTEENAPNLRVYRTAPELSTSPSSWALLKSRFGRPSQ